MERNISLKTNIKINILVQLKHLLSGTVLNVK